MAMIFRSVVLLTVLNVAIGIPFLISADLPLQSNIKTVAFPQRDRSGNADMAKQPATATIEVAGEQITFHIRIPDAGGEMISSPSLRLAILIWNKITPRLVPPSVLFLKDSPGEDTMIAGQVFLDAAWGGPRVERSGGTWQKLGASGFVTYDSHCAEAVMSVPLEVFADLFPDGILVDVRVLNNGVLFSYGAAATWFEPPDSDRAFPVKVSGSGSSASLVKLLTQSLPALPIDPDSQLRAYALKPLPLDQEYCQVCEDVASASSLAQSGNTSGGMEKLQQLLALLLPTETAWQQGMLAIQSLYLEADRLEDSIETGLRLLEANGIWEAIAVPALRNMAVALEKGRIRLANQGSWENEFKTRFLNAVSDSNCRAAYGADLLILQEALPEAEVLLESVADNDAAPTALKSYVKWRLEQLRAISYQDVNNTAAN